MPKSKGYRSKTRKVLKKASRKRGMIPLGRLLREYKLGEKATIIIEPSIHKGMPHKRYHGRVCVISGKRGSSYLVKLNIGSEERSLFVRPEHLRPIEALGHVEGN